MAKPDMDMSEFMGLSTARACPDSSDWIVEFKVRDGSNVNLTVFNCLTEFDAKEEVYFYLLDRIYNKDQK